MLTLVVTVIIIGLAVLLLLVFAPQINIFVVWSFYALYSPRSWG